MSQADFHYESTGESPNLRRQLRPIKKITFRVFKMAFDKLVAVLCLPIIALVALILLVLNPIYNPGALFFSQTRMGRHGKPFRMIKFRTMISTDQVTRGHSDGVEHARITRLGRILRKYRLDELPNMINVLRHEMSVIGPRPDAWDHATVFAAKVPGYMARHAVFPGITGLAQVRQGYAEGIDQTVAKARLDRVYIRQQGFGSELQIILDTIRVILSGFGAR
ncbi:sugar transferase [Rhodophyticola sp.]|uniref:sugar transferase n=1 Tax=Rhodophyticola sp. TaxID=2680032 RepID=UPI003D298461